MSQRAPSWAMAAEAIDGAGDTHLPAGVHVRALPSPRLGLPATPLFVYRTTIPAPLLRRQVREDGVTWIDSRGATLTPPFDVTADNPVTGYFPVPNVVFAELLGTPATISVLPFPPIGPIGPIAPVVPIRPVTPITPVTPIRPVLPITPVAPGRPVIPIAPVTPLRPSATVVAAAGIDTVRAGPAIDARLTRQAAFRVEALASSPLGPAAFQSRSTAPYQLAAWTIPMVRVVGRGTVTGLRWIDAGAMKGNTDELAWTIWSLPVPPAPRYTPTPDAMGEAKDRVTRAAATRQPMYVAYSAASPAAAPAAAPGDAMARIGQVQGQLDKWLKAVLTNLSVPPWAVSDVQAISGAGSGAGTASIPIEPFLISGAVDPDVGHYLGFGDVDQKVRAGVGDLVLYRIRGAWRWVPERWTKQEAASFAQGVQPDLDSLVKGFPELKARGVVPQINGAYVDLFATAVTLIGVVPDIPPVPASQPTTDRGWLATPPPPNVRRAVRLQADGFRPHPVAALTATDASGLRTLHPFPGRGRITIGKPLPPGTPLPLVVSRPQDATTPGQGRFEDRDAPEGAVTYHLAQGDWFGRWGGWAQAIAPAKPRTPPMRPTIEIFAHAPVVASPFPDNPLPGVIELRIPIPRTGDLPAGGAALARLDLDESFGGAAPPPPIGHSLAALPPGASIELHPAPGHDLLVISRPGPALARCASTTVRYTARWIDTLGAVSQNSDPAGRTITDPRPPLPPTVPTTLRYTARPDAAGHARADLSFDSVPGTRYRIFASTETTLLKALDARGQTAAANAIRAAAPGAPRAAAFKAVKALFGWDDFESLTKQPLVASGARTAFSHRLSGSLEVLALYRILGEGPSGQLSEMRDADLIPFAVPNLGGPARPQLGVVNKGLDPTIQGVQLRVKVPIGKAAPKAWRLRRSSVPASDPLAMAIVQTGDVLAPEIDAEATMFAIDATEPLRAWRRYRFVVEVQADRPPGAPTTGPVPPGEWSEASAPVPLAVIPPAAPAAPSAIAIQAVAGGVQVTLTHPAADSLIGTAMGAHVFEYWRIAPGARPERRDLAFVRAAGATWTALDAGSVPPTPGTYVTVRIIDPLGRRSDAAISNPI